MAERPNGGRPTGVRPVDDRGLVEALRRGDPGARAALVERFEPHIERMVTGALGIDPDLQDIIQEVFLRVLERVHQLKDPSALSSWVTSLAVFTARGHIRRRRRWRWIRFLAPQDLPEVAAGGLSPESMSTMRAMYRVLDSLAAEERLAFTLRFMAELELTEVASACGVSLATVKRRLARAEAHIREAVVHDPILGTAPPATRRGKR